MHWITHIFKDGPEALMLITIKRFLVVNKTLVSIGGPFIILCNAFSTPPPRNGNTVGSYTFVMLICADPYTPTLHCIA